MHTCLVARTTTFLVSLSLVVLPAFAGSSGDTKSSTGSDTVQSKQQQSERSDRTSSTASTGTSSTRTTSGPATDRELSRINPQLRTYVPRVNRMESVRDTRERFPQPKDDRPVVFVRSDPEDSLPAVSDKPLERSEIEALLEENEVYVKQKTYRRDIEEERVVFCARSLYEYHVDRDCSMLAGITPTPKKFKSARAARYTACSVCKQQDE